MVTQRNARGIALLTMGALTLGLSGTPRPASRVEVLIRGDAPSAVRVALARHDGHVERELQVIDGAVATIPYDQLTAMAKEPGITVAADRPVAFESVLPGTSYDPVTESGSLFQTASLIGAPTYWSAGFTGSGIGVAVVDTGVQPSSFFGSRLVAGTDLSGEGNALSDGFGHGTHLAGIIGGSSGTVGASSSFTGIAPAARIVSVKVADAAGVTSLVKVLSGLDWVYQNRSNSAYNIKVVNLSLGVPALSSYVNDPLAAGVERLANVGISVVAAAGNIGPGLGLVSPAYDPSVIAVGSLDTKGTVSGSDDAPAAFSAGAVSTDRRPDLVVPGRSIQSLLAAGSAVAANAPASSKIGSSFVVGSGTSQSAAVVSGALALMYQERPTFTPASQKLRITNHTSQIDDVDPRVAGAGKLKLQNILNTADNGSASYTPATAPISAVDSVADYTARAATIQGSSWTGSSWSGSSWSGSSWSGSSWSGSSWSSSNWS